MKEKRDTLYEESIQRNLNEIREYWEENITTEDHAENEGLQQIRKDIIEYASKYTNNLHDDVLNVKSKLKQKNCVCVCFFLTKLFAHYFT